MPNQYTSLKDRFMANWVHEPNTGCWMWIGAAPPVNKQRTDFRPRLNKNGKPVMAHRVAYELFRGEIPKGALVCHTCDTPLCVNPYHLYLGTSVSNNRDTVKRKRHISYTNPEKMRAISAKGGSKNTWTLNRVGKSIIPHKDIPSILKRLASGESYGDVAKTYGVSKQAVANFLKRDKRRQAALAAAKGGQA